MKISECKGKIKVGDWIRTNGDSNNACEFFEGEIGEIQENKFFVWQNKKHGREGELSPAIEAWKYSWVIHFFNPNEIYILKLAEGGQPTKGKKTFMKKLSELTKKLLDKKTRILLEMGFINGDLERAEKGTNALLDILFLEKKEELVALAKEEKEKELKEKKNY